MYHLLGQCMWKIEILGHILLKKGTVHCVLFYSARYAIQTNHLKGDPTIILAGKENFAF